VKPLPTNENGLAPESVIELTVSSEAGSRLDHFLTRQLPHLSRAHLQRAIEAGGIRVNGQPSKPAQKLKQGDIVLIEQLEVPREGPQPQEIPLDILFEDEAIAVVNKPAGMVVHPARGHWDGTLASALAYHFDKLSQTGGPTRPGIVHRLDRDTSGVIAIAKHDQAHEALASQFKSRTIKKEYLAVVVGAPDRDSDIVDCPIGNHPKQREKKAIRAGHPSSREAFTLYEVQERFGGFTLIRAQPQTGRTHQIRLHLAHVGCPVLCDRLYGGQAVLTTRQIKPDAEDDLVLLERQALHAHRLTMTHPTTHERVDFQAPIPEDMTKVLRLLRS
jgi:23S rRNA pseudouridine1911/1915/1917 synthase